MQQINSSNQKIHNSVRNCPICDADSALVKHVHTQVSLDINYQTATLNEIDIDYLLCETCGGVSQSHIPSEEDLANYYSSTPAHGVEPTPQVTREFFHKRLHNVLLATALDQKSNPKALEIGCASGEFSSLLIEKGIAVYGVEPGEKSSAVAAERGIKVLGRSVDEIDSEYLGAFDLVFSMGTLEHLLTPRSVFSAMVQLAKVNGFLYIDVPDNEVIAAGGRNDWGSNIIVPHLHHFTPQSLSLLVTQNSLTSVFFDRCLDVPYSSLAIIAKKASPASYGKESFYGALRAEGSMFEEIAQRLMGQLTHAENPLFWGCGSDLHSLLRTGIFVGTSFKLCDKSQFKIGKIFFGQPVAKPEDVGTADLVIVAVLDPRVAASISADARSFFPESKIISIIDIAVRHKLESSS